MVEKFTDTSELWKKCVSFHGHECGGLTIGFKAAILASKLIEAEFSSDEEIVCVTENDACGIDAIQVILGCTAGKGNLIFKIRGKQAYTFFNRKNGKSVRLVLKNLENLDKSKSPEDLFDTKKAVFQLPEEARIFKSMNCDNCGEKTSENMIRLEDGKHLCKDCYTPYRKFF